MQSAATRRTFLSAPGHQIRFVYTPRHSSWLNQFENWFSILGRRMLKRTNFSSLEDFRKRVLDFIDHFNTGVNKPFKWT
ncbi:MAG: transposase [Gammaproteobacteria bacterium]|nr:transposase [Gammaproteobacteria bacterium]